MKTFLKIVSAALFAFVGFTNITSCSDGDSISEGRQDDPEENITPTTNIAPTLSWGASTSTVKSKQSKALSLTVTSDTLLRYTSQSQGITIDYQFASGKLIATSLTQARLSNLNDIANKWLKGYKQLVQSETALVYTSKDKSTLAYGKILQGSENDYGSVAWTYIDSTEPDDDTDFTPSGTENGYDYVDLGTGIGWAVQNVDAFSPEKYGSYFMWGETKVRTSCWWWYYSLYKGNVNTYLDTDKFYVPFSNISGTSYDAARVRMGGKWRMPTRAELSSLLNTCDISVSEYNGVSGVTVTGPSGKSIFLPAAGEKIKDEIKYTSTVYLWSSTTAGKGDAYHLEYDTTYERKRSITFSQSYYGLPIRAVVDLK